MWEQLEARISRIIGGQNILDDKIRFDRELNELRLVVMYTAAETGDAQNKCQLSREFIQSSDSELLGMQKRRYQVAH